jgi:hypothetical protein
VGNGLFVVIALICLMSLSLILVVSIDNWEDDDSVSLIKSFDNNHISAKDLKYPH